MLRNESIVPLTFKLNVKINDINGSPQLWLFLYLFYGNNGPYIFHIWAILPETTHFLAKKDSWSQILFYVQYASIGPIRVYNPEYQPPVTSGSRVTGFTNFINQQKPQKLQLDINFLFINLFLIFLLEGLTITSGYKKVVKHTFLIILDLTLISNCALFL